MQSKQKQSDQQQVLSFRPREATPSQTAQLCEQITLALASASRKNKHGATKRRQSPLDGSLFLKMWRLVSILELASFDRRVLLTTPSHLQSLQTMTQQLFKNLFCQNALSLFEKSEYAGKSWLSILRKDLAQRMPEMQLAEIEQLLDKNLYGDLSSHRNGGNSKSPPSINRSSPNRQGRITGAAKDLYEVLIDIAIFIIVRLCQPINSRQRAGELINDSTPDSLDVSSDFLGHLVNSFMRHIRQHETLSQRKNEKLGQNLSTRSIGSKAAKRSRDDNNSKTDILTCLPSALTFLKLVQLSKRLQTAAKEKELTNKLFGILPQLFVFDESVVRRDGDVRRALDLNYLIVSQGRQNQYSNQAPGTAGRPLYSIPDGIVTGPGGAVTMESGRSNTLRGLQHSPNKQVCGSPSKQLTGEEKDRGRFRKKADGRPIGNFRANSEPPNEISMHYINSQDDLKMNKELAGTFTKGEQEKILQLNLNQAVIASSATRNRNIHKVPPILVNKIQNLNMQSQQVAQNNFQSTNSSLVMNNFFNMPHGQLYQTQSSQPGTHPPTSGADKNSQYKFVSQPTLAKSRLTRRQQSMTKTSANNLSSNNLLKQVKEAQIANSNSVNLTNLVASGIGQGATNAGGQQTGDGFGGAGKNNEKLGSGLNQTNGKQRGESHGAPNTNNANNPYKDANDETLGSKRSTSQKPKVPVPTLNFTKVLKQSGADSRNNTAQHSMSQYPGTANLPLTNSMLPSAVSGTQHKFMNAQQATSISNNAFIANNFLMPVVASRQSHIQQTRSSRSPVSVNARQDKGHTANGIRETESMFDDVNGSFALENAHDVNPHEFINAEEKLQNLAIQLGESCLTHDLAALMSQKRDLELVESARKIVQKQPQFRRQWTEQRMGVQRSMSQQQNTFADFSDQFSLRKRGIGHGQESFKTAKMGLVERANEILNKNQVQNRHVQRVRYRVVLLNIIANLMTAYSNEEARFVRQPSQMLCSYLESQYFREQRDKKQMRELKKGCKQANMQGTLRMPLDVSQLKALFGQMVFSGEVDDFEKFFMQYDGQTFKIAQLAQCKIQGQTVPPNMDHSIDSSFIQIDNQEPQLTTQNGFNPEHTVRQRQLSVKQTILLQTRDLFKAICLPEVKVVSRLLCKFQFVNEDILRSQVMNELSNFTNRDRIVESKLFASLSNTMTGQAAYHQINQLNQSQLGMATGGGSYNLSPQKHLQASSCDFEHGDGSGPQKGKLLAHQTLSHSQCFWSTNGIAYEITASQTNSILSSKQSSAALVSRESIRTKLDYVLYSVSRRIKYIFSQGFEMTDFQFSDALTGQIIILNAYLEEHKSRTILHQFIEVCLEPLLMVKKALIEISLNTNILVMDFTRNMNISDLLISAKGTDVGNGGYNQNEQSDHSNLKMKLLKRQQRLRDLFSEFLQLCGILLKCPQTTDTLKLFNETLIYDELWLEGIKTFVIALFLSDLVGPVTAQDLNHFQKQQLDDLRGINIVNFEQSFYFGNMMQLREPKFYQIAKESVNRSLLAAMKFLKYLKAVAQFYDYAIQLYFPQSFDQQSKQKASQSQATGVSGYQGQAGIQNMTQPYSNLGYMPGVPTTGQLKQSKDESLLVGGLQDPQKLEAEKQRNQKYWKHVIRKVLYQLMFLITQPNGLFYQYLQNNATNYTNREIPEARKLSKTQKLQDDQDAYQQQVTPMNLYLTQSMLSFMRRIFTLPERFTKYVFDEELLLFYIRTNYISFVKLYNKNFSITKLVQDFQERNETGSVPPELASPKEQEVNKKHREIRKQASLSLCKKLLQCLFAIARNRNEDTRRKLFQFKIVQFLLQEIGLEFEVQQRREKFIKLSKEQQLNSAKKSKAPAQPQAPQPALQQPQPPTSEAQNSQLKEYSPEVMQPLAEKAAPKPKFQIPPLSTGGLGLSTLVDATGKTQEEKDVEKLVNGQTSTNPGAATQQSDMVPPLEINGKKIADAVPSGVNYGNEVEKIIEKTKVSEQQPSPIKKKPFIPPLLGAKNLGMSTIMNADGKTQEELDVEATVNQNAQKAAAQRPPSQQQQPVPNAPGMQAPVTQKKKPFIPPLLGAKSLGMSTLVQANGKTQEENDVENQVRQNQMKLNHPTSQQPLQEQQPAALPNPEVPPTAAPAAAKKKPFIPPLLGAKNLGMSTLVQANGKTQEENDVENQVNQNRAAPTLKPQPPQTVQEETQEPAQAQVAPMQQKKKPFIPPLLGAKNLGMSTLVQANGKTQEENDVNNLVKGNLAQPNQPSAQAPSQPSLQQEPEQQPQPAAAPKKKPFIPPLLGAKNLGMSTLVQANGKTQEENDVNNLVQGNSSQSIQPQAQAAPPVAAPKKKPFIPPLLGAKNLGMSTLVQANGKTQEENDVENQVNQNYHAYQGPRAVPAEAEEEKKLDASDRTDDSEVRRQFGITTNQKSTSQDPGARQNRAANNDGEGSSSEEQAEEQNKRPVNNPGLNQPHKRFVPKLAVKNLGLSTLVKEGQAKTQEELDVISRVEEAKGISRQPIPGQPLLKKNYTVPAQSDQTYPIPSQNNLMQESNNYSSQHQQQHILHEEATSQSNLETDASKRAKASNPRKGLIRQSRSNLRRNVETEEIRSKPITRENAYKSEAANETVLNSVNSPQNVISGFHEHSQINTIMQTSIDGPAQFQPLNQVQMPAEHHGSKKSMLSPPSQGEELDRSRSDVSQGSHIGRNKIFVPYLSFPDDINVDPREKRNVYTKPKGDTRFSLKKSTSNLTNQVGKKVYGKKAKMLEFNIGGETDSKLQDEPVEDERLNAARGGQKQSSEDVLQLSNNVPESAGGDSIQSNKIKKISFLKNQTTYETNPANRQETHHDMHQYSQLQQADRFMSYEASDRRSFYDQKDVSEEVFYMKERSVRPIYQDDELHVLMLSLMMCLLLKPERGTLDELYSSQFPIHDDNQNILYLLHWHLSHAKNQDIVPSLLKKMGEISPPLAGIRLLKLMCPSLFDISLYNNGEGWRKLAAGQYGIVYECQTKFAKPQSVAIKQMSLPQSISDRCVLHDIFTEITCLEEFRLEPCVTDLFDYGVDQTSYYIVMKKYSGSLREWRLRQKPNIMDNLSQYLAIYREVLKAFKVIQSHNVTHYDIKCDNILIDFKNSQDVLAPVGPGNAAGQNRYASDTSQMMFESQQISSDEFTITVGDFGTCHMYYNDKDEFLVSDRGTPNIKSPEMIELELNKRTDTDKYDRRKRVGTSRLSDVWSLGCLFYELLTGEMLFDADEYAWFFVRLTKTQLNLFEDGRLEKINNNVYLIDFLKYILVRDPRLRPTIDNVIKRFEHVYALLVATSSGHHTRFNRLHPQESEIFTQRGSKVSLQQMLQQAASIMISEAQRDEYGNLRDKQHSIELLENDTTENRAADACLHQLAMPTLMRIMEDVFISSIEWLRQSSARVVRLGITHVVIPEQLIDSQISDKFIVYGIPGFITDLPNPRENPVNPYSIMPAVMDFLRSAALFKGRILFVESQADWTTLSENKKGHKSKHLVRECMLMCLAAIYQTSAYETYTLIKSQNLFFTVDSRRLQTISEWTQLCASIQHYLASYPKFSCMCGSSLLILKRQFAQYQNVHLLPCQCQYYHYKNMGDHSHGNQCPSPGCHDFIAFLRAYYRQETEKRGLLPDNQLLWGFFEEEDFVVGPNFSGITDNYHQRQIAASISKTVDKNSTLVAVVDKGRGANAGGNACNGTYDPDPRTDLISRSSATRRNYSRQGGSALGFNHHYGGAGLQRWKLYKCSQCQIWTYAYNEHESRYAVLLNNRVKDYQRQARLGLLAGQDELSLQSSELMNSTTVRVPLLEKIKLKIPF